jgi:tryptophanyl-tRNA synthetase
MSKSLGEKHYIALSDSPDVIKKKISSAVTDTSKGAHAPGVTNLFDILEALNGDDMVSELKEQHKKGKLPYKDLKDVVANTIISHLKPIQERRRELGEQREEIGEILIEGAERAQEIAQKTMEEVREKVGVR